METFKIKFKKIIFDLVESIGNDMELGQAVRKLTNEYIEIKKLKKEKKIKLPKVKKDKVDNFSKIALGIWEAQKQKKAKKNGSNK